MSKWAVENFSPYDNIQYVKLTALGAYVLDRTDTYNASFKLASNKFVLSESNTNIIIEEEMSPESTEVTLRTFAQKISSKRYNTDFQLFLQNCGSRQMLEYRIRELSAMVNHIIPPLWKDFFAELKGKINPLKLVEDFQVYQISPNNAYLIQLISKDEELRKCVFRAEGFYLLIFKSQLALFQKRLKEFGYLMMN